MNKSTYREVEPKQETTQMSKTKMGNIIVVCLYNGILLSSKNKPITDTYNMNESCRHHTEGKMPDQRSQIV